MNDYLKELCSKLNIRLKYLEGTSTILSSSGTKDNITIKASKIFEFCPREVATAVIKYYTDSEDNGKYLKLLKEYAEDNLIDTDYIIQPPDKTFHNPLEKDHVEKRQMKIQRSKESAEKNLEKEDSTTLFEPGITSITQRDLWGTAKKIGADDAIRASNDNVVELDIVINNFNI